MISTSHLFRPLGAELLALLGGLSSDGWHRPTSAGTWAVRDVAAHMLDGDLRRLSAQRDGHVPPPPHPIDSDAELLAYHNDLNRSWLDVAKRCSPQVLLELLETSTTRIADLMESSDPAAPATFPVAWAGQSSSAMWLDMAREYTERWHHQDQIREATSAPPLAEPRWLRPVLEASLLALPHALRNIDAPTGTSILLRIEGAAGGAWSLLKQDGWVLQPENPASPAATITASDLAMSRLLLHRLTRAQAEALIHTTGNADLVAPLLDARAVMV
ncbi:MAG TPA: maleylpyruvate isomerase N-terminal domain-containing protein [Longimicrobiales bacterium]|nr:maleylpyruvate isomerase N-terminal domain-containing protein [Longimicrobiales bacterium]